MEIKIAICDDELEQSQYIKTLVSKWAYENSIGVTIDTFESAENLKSTQFENKRYDILLLDIQMSGQNGIELAKEIRQFDTKLSIIFITGFTDYMSEGYDVYALHYLVKPVKEEKLFEVLAKAVQNLKNSIEILAVNINRRDIFIPLREIIYIESSLNYVNINTTTAQHKAHMALTEIETKLGNGFFKCTRSFIVGLRYVHVITKKDIILTTGVSIPLGRGLYKDINDAFIKYF